MTTRADRIASVLDTSGVAGARRAALECAEAEKLDATASGRAALVATELATNLLKHGGGGSILFASDHEERHALTIIAIDKGRGIGNVAAAMQDGYSTAGSPGSGLGSIRRACALFDVYTLPDRGTAVFCRVEGEVRRAPPFGSPPRIVIGGICLPKPGEEQPGDSWIAVSTRDVVTIAVADGLGHGPAAGTASSAAVGVFAEHVDRPIEDLLREAHGVLRPTRGAAAALARIHTPAGRLDYAGVGNIAATIAADDVVRRTVSLNGIVGHEMRKVQTFSYPWSADSVLVMYSDGLSGSWNPASYPGLLQRHPALIAAVLYRDYCRGNDDATVVVAKAS